MKRVTFAMKQLGMDPAVYTYASFCFSLLLNSTTLTEATDNFRRICTVLLTPTLTHEVTEAKKHIQAALASRDKGDDEDSDERGIDEPGDQQDDEDDETPSAKKFTTLKQESPFTQHFKNIEDTVIANHMSAALGAEDNVLYCPQVVNFLQDRMMPYIFIWGGFVLQGTQLTRITNGVIEKYQGTVKRRMPKNQLPHMHINSNFSFVHGRVVHYLDTLERRKPKKNRKRKVDDSELLDN